MCNAHVDTKKQIARKTRSGVFIPHHLVIAAVAGRGNQREAIVLKRREGAFQSAHRLPGKMSVKTNPPRLSHPRQRFSIRGNWHASFGQQLNIAGVVLVMMGEKRAVRAKPVDRVSHLRRDAWKTGIDHHVSHHKNVDPIPSPGAPRPGQPQGGDIAETRLLDHPSN